MSIPYLLLFALMLLPSLIAMAFSSRNLLAIVWNYAWFLVLAQVGLKAFDSQWGAFPALVFAIQYAMRAMRPGQRPTVNMRFWSQRYAADAEANRPKSQNTADVIDAEFRHEPPDADQITKS